MEVMFRCKLLVICITFYLGKGEDVEVVLAKTNLKGYPSSLLFESVSGNQNEVAIDKTKLAQLLESKEVQAAVTRSALQYSAQVMNQSGQGRYLLTDSSMCENSWVSWLPWTGCEPVQNTPTTTLPLISESSYSCYKP